MADEAMRAQVDAVPVPELGPTPFVVPPPLARATVALVTTAALRRPGEPAWDPTDTGFRVIPDGARDLAIGHMSPNFDRSGFAADLNVAFPVDRLHELAAAGVIGAVAPRHVTFHGVVDGSFSTLLLDSGPAAARLLREDGVDLVLLTPV